MIRSILVPLDGSTFAEHALPAAISLAHRGNIRLHLTTVSTPLAEAYVEGLYFSTVELDQEVTARHQKYLEALADRIRKLVNVPVTVEVLHGEVAASICARLERGDDDMVVMATHGRSPMGRFWLGSVADEMIRHTNVPLLLIRPGEEEVNLEDEPALGRMILPLDGTDLAEQILEPAARIAEIVPDSEIILVRAIHSVVPVAVAPDVAEAEREARSLLHKVQEIQARLRKDAEEYLEGVAARLRKRGLRVQTQVVVEDEVAEAILQEAKLLQAGLIALETHGRRGLSRLILGSVADKLVRGAHIPVMVHRPTTE